MVAAEIMPRSATTQTRPTEKRSRKRSTTGKSVVTSAVFPGHISVQIGLPSPSTTRPRIICLRSGIVIAVLAQRLAAFAIEGEAGGVHEHGGEVGEEVAAAVEQLLLDQVLDAARRERPARLLLQFLAEPGHGVMEVMQQARN
jgi:hypothetical protein